MVKILLHGCSGHMGRVITALAASDPEAEITAGVDPAGRGSGDFPVYGSMEEFAREGKETADVIVDFSTAAAADDLLAYCVRTKTPCVLCTTGLSEAQLSKAEAAARDTAILRSANMSLGINLLMKLLREAAGVLAPAGFDIEIVEKHHNRKLDAPSGTALALADCINEEMENTYRYVYDRSGRRQRREEKEIGISAVRGGTIVGDHDVIFAGEDEVVTFSHTAYSRNIFAKGAVEAAKYLKGKTAGMYDMGDVIDKG